MATATSILSLLSTCRRTAGRALGAIAGKLLSPKRGNVTFAFGPQPDGGLPLYTVTEEVPKGGSTAIGAETTEHRQAPASRAAARWSCPMTAYAGLLRLGGFIKRRRESAGLTRRQLADQAALAVEWLRDLESGAHMERLLRLLAHTAMAGLLDERRRALPSLRGRGVH